MAYVIASPWLELASGQEFSSRPSKLIRLNHMNLKIFDKFDFQKMEPHHFFSVLQLYFHLCWLPLRQILARAVPISVFWGPSPVETEGSRWPTGSDGYTCATLSQSWDHWGALSGLGLVYIPALEQAVGLPGRPVFLREIRKGAQGCAQTMKVSCFGCQGKTCKDRCIRGDTDELFPVLRSPLVSSRLSTIHINAI